MTLWAWRAGEWSRMALFRFFGRSGPRLAAAVAYYVLLSVFPLVLVLVSVAGAVLTDPGLREDFAADAEEVAALRPLPGGPGLRAELLRFLRGLVLRD
jgi:uncharacterized BrkB/YihY/UPF0761 family membrane protein